MSKVTYTEYSRELDRLESGVETLLNEVKRLHEENVSLRDSQESLVTERANLLHKNEQVRSRVEGIVNRLRSLENST